MKKYSYNELDIEEMVACNIIAMDTILYSANENITVQSIADELDIICKIYDRNSLKDIANKKIHKYRIHCNKRF